MRSALVYALLLVVEPFSQYLFCVSTILLSQKEKCACPIIAVKWVGSISSLHFSHVAGKVFMSRFICGSLRHTDLLVGIFLLSNFLLACFCRFSLCLKVPWNIFYSPCWSQTHHQPKSAFQVPALQVCTTMPSCSLKSLSRYSIEYNVENIYLYVFLLDIVCQSLL